MRSPVRAVCCWSQIEVFAGREPAAGLRLLMLWVPKTCATWPDAPLTAGCLGHASGTCQAGHGLPGRGMIFGLWA